MTTKQNITQARLADDKAKKLLHEAKLDFDAFDKYVKEINAGIWDANRQPIPTSGPLTTNQAAKINVMIQQDYQYPAVFAHHEVWNLAGEVHHALEHEIKDLAAVANKTAKTLSEIEASYKEDMDRAREIADRDPAIIEAKANAEAKKIEADAALKTQELANQSSKENIRMIVGGIAGIFFVLIVVVVIARAFK